MKHHGVGSLEQVILTGALAAEGEHAADTPPSGGRRRRLSSLRRRRRRWPKEVDGLLDRMAAVERRDEQEPLRATTRSMKTLHDTLTTVLGARDGEQRWTALFGWTGRPWSSVKGLSASVVMPWVCCKLQAAARLRSNNFGRLLASNAPNLPAEPELDALAAQMQEPDAAPNTGGIPAGFVFLGQFIDHDITLDVITSLHDAAVTVEDVINNRSPRLELDSVYGDGPEASPHLYDQDHEGRLLTDHAGNDLPRNRQGRALLGDPRNDENLFVSQLHLQFLLFHNSVLREIETGAVDAAWGRHPDESDFEFARRMVRWHYQWIVVNEYLPQVVADQPLAAAHAITGVREGIAPASPLPAGYGTARDHLNGLGGVDCCGHGISAPKMPVEFSGAAFRFAHSQVPGRLDINSGALDVPLFTPSPPAPGAFGPIAARVEWPRFFSIDGSVPQSARPIDTSVVEQLFNLPFAPGAPSLPSRNLVRSSRVYALPTGEDAVQTLGLATAMSPAAGAKVAAAGLAGRTPLWFFCLGEAENNGNRLGPLGGLIVGWTLLHMLRSDEHSYLHDVGWSPVAGGVAGDFTMEDLLTRAATEKAAMIAP